MNRALEPRTTVIGCVFTTDDLQFVRFEYCALVSVAFDVPGRVIFYTKKVERGNVEDRELAQERIVLRRILGGLWNDNCFGIHELSGGAFETIVPERRRRSPRQEEFDQWLREQAERENEDALETEGDLSTDEDNSEDFEVEAEEIEEDVE